MNGKVRPKWYVWGLALSCVMVLVSGGMLFAQAPNPQGGGDATVQPLVEDTEWGGVKAELTAIERTSGDMLTIKFKYINGGSKEADISRLGQFSHDNVVDLPMDWVAEIRLWPSSFFGVHMAYLHSLDPN